MHFQCYHNSKFQLILIINLNNKINFSNNLSILLVYVKVGIVCFDKISKI